MALYSKPEKSGAPPCSAPEDEVRGFADLDRRGVGIQGL